MKLIKILTLLSLPFFYLLFSYVRFYHYIGYTNLQSPYNTNSITLGNNLENDKVLYIALGDSLSAGVGSLEISDTFTYVYATNLTNLHKQVVFTNLGQPGGTTTDVINNQLPEAIKQNPDYITLLIGTNDVHNKKTKNEFENNYSYILSELHTKTQAKVTVLNIPYLGSSKVVYPPFNLILNYRTKQFNEIIKKVVTNIEDKDRIKLIDLYSSTYLTSKSDPDYYSSDEFHPSGKGYIIWGNLINEY